jgi:hypothetical protein
MFFLNKIYSFFKLKFFRSNAILINNLFILYKNLYNKIFIDFKSLFLKNNKFYILIERNTLGRSKTDFLTESPSKTKFNDHQDFMRITIIFKFYMY